MNSIIVDRFEKIKSKITSLKPDKAVNIIAVSKTFPLEDIKPLIDYGHQHFGENKVQEAKSKWSQTKKEYENIKLHMIGKLQSNKAKDAVKLFDYIHSLDNQKLADNLAKFQNNLNKRLKYFIQVNIGNEIQTYVEAKGFSVVRDFCGHGIGDKFHEPPNILHYGKKNTGTELKPGMTFTIEPMINSGKFEVKILEDGWTAVSKDKSLSAQFEHTVGIKDNGYEIFTESAKGYLKPPYN